MAMQQTSKSVKALQKLLKNQATGGVFVGEKWMFKGNPLKVSKMFDVFCGFCGLG